MKIKRLHAHFLITTDNYQNERVGFSVELSEGENVEEVVSLLRTKAAEAIGESADKLIKKRRDLSWDCKELETKLSKLREEWDATAQFLKAQGLNPDAPSMPQFSKLLNAVKVDAETVITEIVDEEKYEDEDEFEDDEDE